MDDGISSNNTKYGIPCTVQKRIFAMTRRLANLILHHSCQRGHEQVAQYWSNVVKEKHIYELAVHNWNKYGWNLQ